MEKELHILILEDLPSDVELAQREIEKIFKNYTIKVVETEKGFTKALTIFKPDLIISDYLLPSFDGLSALKIKRKISPLIPFVVLTGSMNEDTAVDCMKAGADDYVIKEHIKRLGPAVLNAIENKRIELEQKQAELELQIERDKLIAIFESMADGIYIVNKDYDIQYVNPVLKRTFGSPEGKKCHKYFHDSDEPCTFCKNDDVFAGKTVRWEWASPKDSKTYDLIDTPIKNANGSISKLEISRDITERKQAEEKYRSLFESSKDGIGFSDMKGNLIDANQALLDMVDYKMDEIGKLPYIELFPKKWRNTGVEMLKNQALVRGYSDEQEMEFIKKDGTIFPISVRVWMIRNKQGKPEGMWSITRDITERKKAEQKLKKTLDATIETMSKIIEVKDPYTAGHQQRVSQLATAIAKELNLSPDKIEGIRVASLIHDIGKISVPTEILSKSTTLSDLEFSLIKEHSQTGYDILKPIDFSYPVAQIVLQHHERINGTGYPNNLKGDKILPEAKIIGVADVVEAMSSHRPYRPALGIDAALEEIIKNKGTLYDPEVVDICLKLFKERGFKFK